MTIGRTGNEEADAFEPIRDRLNAWRQRREPGEHIPEEIWSPAVKLARRFGISKTSTTLRLGFRELKARVERTRQKPSRHQRSGAERFVELPCDARLLGGQECLIEVEDREMRVRIALSGRGTSEVASVIEALMKRAIR